MGADGIFTVCPGCGNPVEPGADGTILMVEQVDFTLGLVREWIDGKPAWFHRGHGPPRGSIYRKATPEESENAARAWREEHP